MLSLRELRAIAGMTLVQMGERLGLQDEEVQELKRSELRSLTVDQLVRYCSALGMPVTITVGVHSRPAGKVEILSTRKLRS
jgi:transcriptional regulator with XRE-family HTH domain